MDVGTYLLRRPISSVGATSKLVGEGRRHQTLSTPKFKSVIGFWPLNFENSFPKKKIFESAFSVEVAGHCPPLTHTLAKLEGQLPPLLPPPVPTPMRPIP